MSDPDLRHASRRASQPLEADSSAKVNRMFDLSAMTVEKKKEKILSAIASRGWFTAECYWNEACELRNAGLVQLSERFSTGGNRKPVWVKA